MSVYVDDLKSLEEDPDALADNEEKNNGEEDEVTSLSILPHALNLRVHHGIPGHWREIKDVSLQY